jgi:hypothetical protein
MTRLLIATVVLVLSLAGTASATDTVLSAAPDSTGITAYGGHVVFSRYDGATSRWALVRWHAGVLDQLPVPERSVPFDADAGPDAQGNPVVVYSRCSTDPAAAGAVPDWETARGCDVYELPLTGTAAERKLTPASSSSASETTPSIWQGALAFARHRDGAAVPTLQYMPAGATASRRLGGGSVQTCSGECRSRTVHDSVDQLDLGPSRLAYVWRMTGGSVFGIGLVWELRSSGRYAPLSTLLDSGLISGTCGYHEPTAPDASGSRIGYLSVGSPDCDVPVTTRFATVDPPTGARASAPTSGGAAADAARDGTTLYWLRVTSTGDQAEVAAAGSCGEAGKSCELVASTLPTYAADTPLRTGSAPADVDLVRSGFGYRWVRGPAGVRLLRPPAHIPCGPSSVTTYISASAQWSSGRHTVLVRRTDSHGAHRVGVPITRSLPTGVANSTRLVRCGDRMRLTYTVTTGRSKQSASFSVSRRPAA